MSLARRALDWFRRPGRLALFLLLLATVSSVAVLRELDKPWRKPASVLLYSGDPEQLTLGEKVLRPWQVLCDPGPEGRKTREEMETAEWAQVGLWYGALGHSLLCLLLALTWAWWHPLTRLAAAQDPVGGGWRDGFRSGKWSVLLLLLALGIAGASRLPYLGRAPLWDEQDNLRRNYHGFLDWRSPDVPMVWRGAGMREAFWENRRANNPAMMSVLGQVSNHLWRAAGGAPRERFSPVALRLPVALAALAGIAALWWMMNVLGWRQAAPVAALLAALHPLHAEYSIQARGYGFVLLSVPLAIGAAYLAWRRVAWRDIWLFGLALLTGLWAYPGSVYFAACTGGVLAVAFLWRWLRRGDRAARAGLARLVVCGLVLAAAFAWLMAPSIPQLFLYIGETFQQGHMPTWWYLSSYLMYATGMLFYFPGGYYLMDPWTSPSAAEWMAGPFFSYTPMLAAWSLVLVPASMLAGSLAWWRRRGDRMAVALAFATGLAVVACLVHNARSGNFIYGWYVIFSLPVFIALVAQGWCSAGQWLAQRASRVPAWPLAFLMLAAFALLTHPAFGWRPYDLGDTELARRPAGHAWRRDSPDEIGRAEFQRGDTLWVVYKDGLQIAYHGSKAQADQIARHLKRYRPSGPATDGP